MGAYLVVSDVLYTVGQKKTCPCIFSYNFSKQLPITTKIYQNIAQLLLIIVVKYQRWCSKFPLSALTLARGPWRLCCTDSSITRRSISSHGMMLLQFFDAIKYYKDVLCYRVVLLMQCFLPNTKEITKYFIFQQDRAPAHRARYAVRLLETETQDFIRPTL